MSKFFECKSVEERQALACIMLENIYNQTADINRAVLHMGMELDKIKKKVYGDSTPEESKPINDVITKLNAITKSCDSVTQLLKNKCAKEVK